jgi:hypothetical protein
MLDYSDRLVLAKDLGEVQLVVGQGLFPLEHLGLLTGEPDSGAASCPCPFTGQLLSQFTFEVRSRIVEIKRCSAT